MRGFKKIQLQNLQQNLNLKSTNPTKSRNKNNRVFDTWKQNARNAQWDPFKMKGLKYRHRQTELDFNRIIFVITNSDFYSMSRFRDSWFAIREQFSLRWCIGIRSNLNIWPQTECLSHEGDKISEKKNLEKKLAVPNYGLQDQNICKISAVHKTITLFYFGFKFLSVILHPCSNSLT